MRYLSVLLLVFVPQTLMAQSSGAMSARAVVGTYREHTSVGAGCTIEVGEPKASGVRIQFDCNRGAPSYNHGADDFRAPVKNSVATYASRNANGTCRLRFAFARDRVRVTQEGRDQACGFGAFVTIDGTYPRVSRRPPKFDLLPL
jgi:hypothetical protein